MSSNKLITEVMLKIAMKCSDHGSYANNLSLTLMAGSCVILSSCPSCYCICYLCGHADMLGSLKKITHMFNFRQVLSLTPLNQLFGQAQDISNV